MTQIRMLTIAEKAIYRELQKKRTNDLHLNIQLMRVRAMILMEKEKNNEQ